MGSDSRFTVARERVVAALPYVRESLPEATYADVRGALIGDLPGIDPDRWHAWNRADYGRQLDAASPRELARIAIGVLVNLTDLRVRDGEARRAVAEAYRILGLTPPDR